MKFKLFVLLSLLAFSAKSFGWGGRGHHSLCDAATYLVKDKKLRLFLSGRPQIMGHLCNIPDTYWRNLPAAQTSIGNPGHYIDVEITGMKIADVPVDYKFLIKTYEGTDNKMKLGTNIKSFPTEFGSLWWRADQFFRRAVEAGKDIKDSPPPKTYAEGQDANLKYNRAIYQMMVNMGIMGHFVGDASQPYHATYDYDGYGTGHGGIHVYYEDDGVNAQGPDLVAEIVKAAKKIQDLKKSKPDFLTAATLIDKMKALSIVSAKEIAAVSAIDPMTKPSKVEKVDSKDVKTAAERAPAAKVANKFKPLIISEMARSSVLLAQLWDEAYEQVGSPDLSHYQSYQFPFMPDFVAPDYFEVVAPK